MVFFVWVLGGMFGVVFYIMLTCIQAGCPLQAWQNAFWLAWISVVSFAMCGIVQGEIQ